MNETITKPITKWNKSQWLIQVNTIIQHISCISAVMLKATTSIKVMKLLSETRLEHYKETS